MSKQLYESKNWIVSEHHRVTDELIILLTLKGECQLDNQQIAMTKEQYKELLSFSNIRNE